MLFGRREGEDVRVRFRRYEGATKEAADERTKRWMTNQKKVTLASF